MGVVFGLIAGNVLYQLIFSSTPNYMEAVHISFMQVIAVVAYAIFNKGN